MTTAIPLQPAWATKPATKVSTEDFILSVDCTALLRSGETVSSATIDAVTTDGQLTIGSASVNGTTVTDDNGNTLAIGTVVSFNLSGGTAATDPRLGTVYVLRVNATLNTGKKRAGLVQVLVQG